jgi:phosphoribosyl-AMP cyclohydrolase
MFSFYSVTTGILYSNFSPRGFLSVSTQAIDSSVQDCDHDFVITDVAEAAIACNISEVESDSCFRW